MARIKYWDEESQTWKYADKSLGPNIDLTEYAKKEDIPTKLPNPNALTFTGAVNATYDGSVPVEVAIPDSPQNASKGWELLTDITLEEDATIDRINYDTKYNYMYGEIIISKVTEVIPTGNSAFFLNAPLYYANIGSKNYKYRILCYFEKVDDNAFFAASAVGELTGVGGVINLTMRNITDWGSSIYSPYKMQFSVALPAGTTIKVYGKE